MKKFLGIALVITCLSAGLFASLHLGMAHGAKGYFIGALLGFGGGMIIWSAVIKVVSKPQKKDQSSK